MHELSIAQSLVEIAVAEATRAGARRVLRVRCRVGAMRQVVPEMLVEAFGWVRAGTMCAEAELEVESPQMRATCRACGHAYDVHGWVWTCPACGGEDAAPAGGDELELTSIEAEVGDGD